MGVTVGWRAEQMGSQSTSAKCRSCCCARALSPARRGRASPAGRPATLPCPPWLCGATGRCPEAPAAEWGPHPPSGAQGREPFRRSCGIPSANGVENSKQHEPRKWEGSYTNIEGRPPIQRPPPLACYDGSSKMMVDLEMRDLAGSGRAGCCAAAGRGQNEQKSSLGSA